jgi:hypothetical protein
MKYLVAAAALLSVAWTLSVCSPTNGIVCVTIVEPSTNLWVIEASADLSTWQPEGQYVTGNATRCMFIPPSDAPPDKPWLPVRFYRARLMQ